MAFGRAGKWHLSQKGPKFCLRQVDTRKGVPLILCRIISGQILLGLGLSSSIQFLLGLLFSGIISGRIRIGFRLSSLALL